MTAADSGVPDWPQLIEDAAARIASRVRTTPTIEVAMPGSPHWRLTLKLEYLQHSGSFKARGAFNNLLARTVPAAGVIAASGGNHGAAVAYAARELGHRAEIFVPTIAAPAKIARLRECGAELNITGANFAETLQASETRQAETGAMTIHAYDQLETIAGQGTMTREFEEQCPNLDSVVIAVGGGGLIGGAAGWLQDRKRIVAVETDGTQTLASAHAAGTPVDIDVTGLAADALGARRLGNLAFPLTEQHVTDRLVISDEHVREAQVWLWRELRVLVEPAGAAALAACLSGHYKPRDGEHVGVVVCGANTDPASLA
ncbi:MAG: threonine/serine dehydratase [Pseudomonadota bacterium]